MRLIKLPLFNCHSLICEVLDKLDENFIDNTQWIQDCITDTKNRQGDDGPTVPMTPKGRPKTRNYMRQRALRLELANRLNCSRGSTPRLNGSVAISAVPHYLNRSAGIKDKIAAKAIKNVRKKSNAKPSNVKIQERDPLRTALFRSPVGKVGQPTRPKAPPSTAASGVQETAKNDRLRKRPAKHTEQKVEIEKKPPAPKGRPRQVPLNNGLKNNLKFLANNLLNLADAPKQITAAVKAVPPPPPVSASAGAFKSPIKNFGKVSIKVPIKPTAKTRPGPTSKPMTAKIILEEEEEEKVDDESSFYSFCPDVCDKSLQVSMPSLIEQVPGSLNPFVKLVDIGATLSSAMNEPGRDKATPQNSTETKNKKSLSVPDLNEKATPDFSKNAAPDFNGKTASDHNGKVALIQPKILSSTPANARPVVMLEMLDLTMISPMERPREEDLDVSYEILGPSRPMEAPVVSAPAPTTAAPTTVPPSDGSTKTNPLSEVPAKINFVPLKVNNVPANIPCVQTKAVDGQHVRAALPTSAKAPEHQQVVSNNLPAQGHQQKVVPVASTVVGGGHAAPKSAAAESFRSVLTISSSHTTAVPPYTESSYESYDMTPGKKVKKFLPSTENDYNIRDISSDDSTDDEGRPRKVVPQWARKENLTRALIKQATRSLEEVHSYFGSVVHENMDLNLIFPNSKRQVKLGRRTSSAHWVATPLKKRRF